MGYHCARCERCHRTIFAWRLCFGMPKVSGCSPGRNKPFTLRYSFMALQDKLIDALGRF
ncbi:PTS sugar transporter subunit IIC, partial [Pseudomonas donghuensis]|nr:PTS sugar transporter subunit IIC [Pseudomonas donghuensis]